MATKKSTPQEPRAGSAEAHEEHIAARWRAERDQPAPEETDGDEENTES